MSMPCNKSSSSSAAPNPNPRCSEISNPVRRSFCGNPFAKPSVMANPRNIFPNTPANSPSDFTRRNSVGGRDLDDKENVKDQVLKPTKVRSPAGSLNSKKNFMSPTISASFKVAESPRKKVLIERNEPARTSISSTDGKSPVRKVTFAEPLDCGGLNPDDGVEEKKFDTLLFDVVPNDEMHRSSLTSQDLSVETVHDMNVPLIPNNETESSTETIAEEPEPDCVNLDPSFRFSPTPPPVSSIATILAPLEADPLMPPYDPKGNYLSPRPQFLHYRPKPRIQLCNKREFEDSFLSGSFSDTQVTEDSHSAGSQKNSEDVSSNEIVEEEAGQVSEPIPARIFVVPEETIGAKEVSLPRFSMRSKAIALILLLSVAFLLVSVTKSPVMDHTVFKDFYEIYESSEFSGFARANFDQFSEFANANFNGLALNFHIWFTKSLSSVSELISSVRGEHILVSLQYCNLTALHSHTGVNQYPIFGPGEKEIDDTPQVNPPVLNVRYSDTASEIDDDEDIEAVSEEHYEVYEEHVQQDMDALDAPDSDIVFEGQPVSVIEPELALQLAEAGNLEAKQAQENDASYNAESHPGLNLENVEIHIEDYGTGNFEEKQAQENDANFNVDRQRDAVPKVSEIFAEVYDDKTGEINLKKAEGNYITIDAAVRKIEQILKAADLVPRMVFYLLLCGATVSIAGAALNLSRKGKGRNTRVASSVQQPLVGKALHSPKVVKEFNESQSLEKKHRKNYRRESLASSSDYSMGSASYGSLTVYEKIPSKHGRGDEETATPVRRSSRIRNQASSPL